MQGTFGARWDARSTRGFDYLRIGLAVAVVVHHGVQASYGGQAFVGLPNVVWIPIGFVLPAFFALSGFLVASSLVRCRTIEGFVTLRALRLLPALAVEVLLAALVIGPLLTTLPLDQYFSDEMFHRYFRNILGQIHFELPGLFADNPEPRTVNISLWTVPYELQCYLVLIGLAVIGLIARRQRFLVALLSLLLILPAIDLLSDNFFRPLAIVPGSVLVAAFLAGIGCFLYRDRIPTDRRLLALALGASAISLSAPALQYFCFIPVAYVTVWLGLTNPPRNWLIESGDYSYGIYLFAFPIQQMIASAPWGREWWINVGLTLPLSLAYACFSWHLVEAPILRRKRGVVALAEQLGAAIRRPFAPWIASRQ